MGELTEDAQRQLHVVIGAIYHLLGRAHYLLAKGRITSADDEETLSLVTNLASWWDQRKALETPND